MRIPLIPNKDNLLGRWKTIEGDIAIVETGPVHTSIGEMWIGYVIDRGGYQNGAKWYPDGTCYYSKYSLRERVIVDEANGYGEIPAKPVARTNKVFKVEVSFGFSNEAIFDARTIIAEVTIVGTSLVEVTERLRGMIQVREKEQGGK